MKSNATNENTPTESTPSWRYGAAVFSIWTQFSLVVIIALISINYGRTALRDQNSNLNWQLRNIGLKFCNPESLARQNFADNDLRMLAVADDAGENESTVNLDLDQHLDWQSLADRFGVRTMFAFDSAKTNDAETEYIQTARRFVAKYNSQMIRLARQSELVNVIIDNNN